MATYEKALTAIIARINGEWDSPTLVAHGALSSDPIVDILGIAEDAFSKGTAPYIVEDCNNCGAAPELLEALEATEGALASFVEGNLEPNLQACDAICDMARAAIANAKGI